MGKDKYRKPQSGMWDYFVKNGNEGEKVDISKSVFVGDAAGRKKTPKRPADHSDADKGFAINVGIPFKVPEEFFLG